MNDNIHWKLQKMYDDLLNGIVNIDSQLINQRVIEILNLPIFGDEERYDMNTIIKISNILYNNTAREMLPLEDGIYDLCMTWAINHIPNYQVGAKPVKVAITSDPMVKEQRQYGFTVIDPYDKEELFTEDIRDNFDNLRSSDFRNYKMQGGFVVMEEQSKSYRDTAHVYPELVGTLDKYKFVLNKDAIEREVFDDQNVAVLERDFFQPHIQMGILDPNRIISVSLELKMDGISIEGDILGDEIVSARTRGDTNNDEATDLSNIFRGWKFPKAINMPKDEKFGIKFEAMISNLDLSILSQVRDKYYKNPRNTMSGIIGSNDAQRWLAYITLIPLETSYSIPRDVEIEFLNTYYATEPLRHVIITGNYMSILYQISKFCNEAEYLRPIMPYLYDGIVVRYMDQDIINALGRVNSVNRWCAAVKFNAQKKTTVFIGYTYSIGQNGVITPIAHYNPVELFGCIHQKTTVHSYKRFMELSLKEGDIVTIELINDVIPYISKPEVSDNEWNNNEVIPFPTECPECGAKLEISASGKSIVCPNMGCPGRQFSRITNMLSKLGFKDFSDATVKLLGPTITGLKELMDISYDTISEVLGPVETSTFFMRINELRTEPIKDYRIIGALGFSNVAQDRWAQILREIGIDEILEDEDEELYNKLISIKGIGKAMAITIIKERFNMYNDLEMIRNMPNVEWSLGQGFVEGYQIRFSGFRDKELIEELSAKGYDISDKGVTSKTNILIVPYKGYESSKTRSVSSGCIIVTLEEFEEMKGRLL